MCVCVSDAYIPPPAYEAASSGQDQSQPVEAKYVICHVGGAGGGVTQVVNVWP